MSHKSEKTRTPALKAAFALSFAVASAVLVYLALDPRMRLPDEEVERYALAAGSLAWLLGVALAILCLAALRPWSDEGPTHHLPGAFCLLVSLFALLILAVAIPEFLCLSVERVTTAPVRTQDMNHLKQLANAMHEYADDHGGALPPAAVYDAEGNPLLSWRVLLLPYLGQEGLYRRFRLDERWDSENNLPLLEQMPPVYRHPRRDRHRPPHATNYFVLVGEGAAFEGREGVRLRASPDRAMTILVVEATPAVPWTKPEERAYLPGKPLPPLGGLLTRGFNAAFADGSVRFVQPEVSEATLRALITRDGKDKPGDDW